MRRQIDAAMPCQGLGWHFRGPFFLGWRREYQQLATIWILCSCLLRLGAGRGFMTAFSLPLGPANVLGQAPTR